ncbi:hypothetical protein AVEN_197505-1 [Araneus ventricosus]|uniref:Sushi domain-containing protein n=1 Tax=Araneus ventricosus TaxID=182803 RepID=A0A4Y2BT01_ARAVE|nr:hypothetical protein AVEN_197505-1 [Araneus ventricosus]
MLSHLRSWRQRVDDLKRNEVGGHRRLQINQCAGSEQPLALGNVGQTESHVFLRDPPQRIKTPSTCVLHHLYIYSIIMIFLNLLLEQKVFCRYPDLSPNSRLITSSSRDRMFPPRMQLLYVCNEGYNTRDPLVIQCMLSGQWSSPPPTCTSIFSPRSK